MRVAARINRRRRQRLLLLAALAFLINLPSSGASQAAEEKNNNEDSDPNTSQVSKDASPAASTQPARQEDAGKTTVVPTSGSPTAAATAATRPSEGAEQTQTSAATRGGGAPFLSAATAKATPTPTVPHVFTTLQAATLAPNSATAAPTAAPAPATTSGSPKDATLATATGSPGTLVGSPVVATTASPTKRGTTAVTVAGAVGPGTTVTPTTSTAAPSLQHHSTHSSITSTPENSNGATVAAGNPKPTTQSAGTTGFTGTPGSPGSTSLTKTGSPTNTTATKAGAGLAQTTQALPSTLGPGLSTRSPEASTLGPGAFSHGPDASTDETRTATTTLVSQPRTFVYSLNKKYEDEEEKDLVEVCRRLMANMQDGNCTLVWQQRNGKIHFDFVEINGKVKTRLAAEYYEEITKKPADNRTLIAILASCGALLIMIVILAVCASHHRRPYGENQQHLTEELHTVENGYHDNPTLEVMEVQSEMQEKKTALNGEFNDSWIVPIDNLMKDDAPDEEDTHL